MPKSDRELEGLTDDRPGFVTTHWSVVLAAGQKNTPSAAEALEKLCRTYWYPLYAHVRRRGSDAEAARDLTQGFFTEILSKNSIAAADSDRGRFRTFLLAALDNYLHNRHRDSSTLKRGGDKDIISWDAEDAEERYALEPADQNSPDREFDQRWAMATLARVREQLRTELSVSGKAELFDLLRPHLFGDLEAAPQAQVAGRLKMTTVAVKVTIYRLRQRYGELLRDEVAHTLADPAQADQEIRHLIAALGR